MIKEVSGQLVRVLGLRDCHFQYGVAGLGQPARLRDDGQVEWKHKVWDVMRDGLPVEARLSCSFRTAADCKVDSCSPPPRTLARLSLSGWSQ